MDIIPHHIDVAPVAMASYVTVCPSADGLVKSCFELDTKVSETGHISLSLQQERDNRLTEIFTGTWEGIDLGEVVCVTPLHAAVVFHRLDFAAYLLKKCPHTVLELDMFEFCCAVRDEQAAVELFTTATCMNFLYPTCFSCPRPAILTLPKLHDLKAVETIRSKQRRSPLTATTRLLLGSIEQRSMEMYIDGSMTGIPGYPMRIAGGAAVDPVLSGLLQGLCVLDTSVEVVATTNSRPLTSTSTAIAVGKQSSLSSFFVTPSKMDGSRASTPILLMQGQFVSFEDLVEDRDVFSRTAPAPVLACGINKSGFTLLHEALATSTNTGDWRSTAVALMLLHNNRHRLLATNEIGVTPLFMAIRHNQWNHAKYILESLLEDSHRFSDVRGRRQLHQSEIERGSGGSYESLLVLHSSMQTRVKANVILYDRAKARLQDIEEEVESYQCTFICAPPAAASLGHLMNLFARTEKIWHYITHSDFLRLVQISYTPAGLVLDSIVRAKQVLTIIGVPFSHIGSTAVVAPSLNGRSSTSTLGRPFDRLDVVSLRKLLPVRSCLQLRGKIFYIKSF